MTGPASIELRLALVAALTLLGAMAFLLGPGAAQGRAAECAGSSTPAYKLNGPEARKATLCLLNRERANRGMSKLKADGKQEKAAAGHNRVMIRKDCFSHQCAGERDLVGRAEAAGYLPCNCSWSIGENIAWASGSASSPREIVDSWMNSPPHRSNILNRQFEHIGVAVDQGSPGGVGAAATYTTDFGFKD